MTKLQLTQGELTGILTQPEFGQLVRVAANLVGDGFTTAAAIHREPVSGRTWLADTVQLESANCALLDGVPIRFQGATTHRTGWNTAVLAFHSHVSRTGTPTAHDARVWKDPLSHGAVTGILTDNQGTGNLHLFRGSDGYDPARLQALGDESSDQAIGEALTAAGVNHAEIAYGAGGLVVAETLSNVSDLFRQ